ncbi:hypothetical protein [Hydrococcus rivularis]|nr:hypothetical protein [Hydrococcus rivularis]
MTEIVDRPHPQPLSLFGRGEKNVARENLKIGIIPDSCLNLILVSKFIR